MSRPDVTAHMPVTLGQTGGVTRRRHVEAITKSAAQVGDGWQVGIYEECQWGNRRPGECWRLIKGPGGVHIGLRGQCGPASR